MKKIIAIVLLLAMLIPLGLVNVVSGAEAEVKPFYFVNNKSNEFGFDNVFARINFSTSRYKGQGEAPVYANLDSGVVRGIPEIAQAVKELLNPLPDGARYIMLYKTIDIVQPEAMIYMDKGTQLYAEWADAFFKEYKAIGGKLDGVLLDVEYNYTYAYYLYQIYRTGGTILNDEGKEEAIPANPAIYKEIVEHPLYATEIRPLLEERGFTFIQGSGNKAEIFNITDTDSKDASIWNAVMHNRQAHYMETVLDSVRKHYSDIITANYCFSSGKAWNSSVNTVGGNTVNVGTTSNEEYYVRRPTSKFYDTTDGFSDIVTYNGAVYADTVFNNFLYELNNFKAMYASSDTKRISAFVAGFNYKDRNRPANGTRNTPYYSETLLHIGMLNPEVFLGYIVGPRDTDIDGEPYDYEAVMTVVSELMSELTRVAGYADRKAIEIPKTWNSSFALSGMYAGGRNIWRITPDTTITTLENFKIEGKDPTFRINGQTVTFPGGKIIEDGKISHIGTCGYWVETAADVTPIVTSDVDRYSQFPAFGEDFDGYKTGMEYSYYNVEFPTSWIFKLGKSAKAIVEEDKTTAGNKVLALTGDVTLRNTKVLENVTAGDTYAENQAWEVSITVPANMGADAEIVALSITDAKGKVIDGGFQLTGGKLSYYNADKYVAFEGVDLTAGGKYTFVREMNFTTAGAFTCNYIVRDANGKEVASAKDIAVAAKVELPLHSIGLTFSKVPGTVYVDDYKLYAIGVATDFMLYDEKTGIRVAELDKARSANTAYRLSWLNGTAQEKVYSIVAEYSGGETKVIEEIKMAPNTDAVATGIVTVTDGQSVRVYLRDDSPAEPGDNNGTEEKPDDTKPTGKIPVILLGVCGGIVVLALMFVALVLVAVKKKKTVSTEDEAAE